jgi:hypothetical protein
VRFQADPGAEPVGERRDRLGELGRDEDDRQPAPLVLDRFEQPDELARVSRVRRQEHVPRVRARDV